MEFPDNLNIVDLRGALQDACTRSLLDLLLSSLTSCVTTRVQVTEYASFEANFDSPVSIAEFRATITEFFKLYSLPELGPVTAMQVRALPLQGGLVVAFVDEAEQVQTVVMQLEHTLMSSIFEQLMATYLQEGVLQDRYKTWETDPKALTDSVRILDTVTMRVGFITLLERIIPDGAAVH